MTVFMKTQHHNEIFREKLYPRNKPAVAHDSIELFYFIRFRALSRAYFYQLANRIFSHEITIDLTDYSFLTQ